MVLTSLSLQNFRNYCQHSFNFSPNTTIIVGPNASGKTNILEAIYLLATGKSFRAGKGEEMISYGKELSAVSCQLSNRNTGSPQSPVVADGNEKIKLEVMLTTGQVQGQAVPYKKLSVDGAGKRLTDFAGNLQCVVFWPEDLELITRSPSHRRKYLDSVLYQTDRKYRLHLIAFEKALRNRNKLLEKIREGQAGRNQLDYWDKLVIESGQYLTDKRENFLEFVNTVKLADKHKQPIPKGLNKRPAFAEGFSAVYDKSTISENRLAKYARQEVAAAATLVGPHRDDFKLKVKSQKLKIERSKAGQSTPSRWQNVSPSSEVARRDSSDGGTVGQENSTCRNLHTFGSRGEQRLAVLWLKLAELAFVEKVTGERPILLLDDILSELDHQHRGLVFEVIGKQQTIITTTDEHLVEGENLGYKLITLD